MLMSRFRYKYFLILTFLFFSLCNLICAQDNPAVDQWKFDLQILLGFTEDEVDGVMGIETFNALKRFAYNHDLADVVLRGQFEDIERWGFEQYLMKYHAYWIREIKNQGIFKDMHNKEYLRQADETLYTFEIAIQNAKLEVERLTQAKLKEERLAKEQQETQNWEVEKNEAERLTAELQKSIMAAELESEKWALERKRAQRLAEEKEQLTKLQERKLEAAILVSDFEDVIEVAAREIDRLIVENNKIKTFITASKNTKLLAEELKTELRDTRIQIDSLSIQKDSLEKKLLKIELLVAKKTPPDSLEKKLLEIEALVGIKSVPSHKKKKWYQRIWPFRDKKQEVEESPPSNKEKDGEESSTPEKKKKKKWYKRIWPFGDKKKDVEESTPSPNSDSEEGEESSPPDKKN